MKQQVLLLVVVESSGSSPGRPGFKMAVDAGGALCGSIGGGIMEIKLVELARDRLKKGQAGPLLKRQIHDKTAPHDQSGMICSGAQTVLFRTLQPEDLPAVRRLVGILKVAQPAVLSLSASAVQIEKNKRNERSFLFKKTGAADFLLEENLGFQNRLFIVGGGHCALALSALVSGLDFHLTLFDDRPALNTLSANRFVHVKHLIGNYAQIGDLIPAGDDVYVVIMTLGYRSDEVVVRQLMQKNLRYLGLLGSAAKVAVLLENLRKEGFSAEKLQKIHAPIGLDINSRTPEEIAVSIAAQLIAVKNGKI